MLLVTYFQRCACAALLTAVGLGSLGHAADLPDYMQPIAGVVTVSPTEVANDNLLALNRSMFQLYDETGKLLQRNILAQHPVILGLFSGAGGRFILYRPGMAPLEAPPVPMVYQLLKSVGHSTIGSERGGCTVYRQSREPGMACITAGLSQPDAIGIGYARSRRAPARPARCPAHHSSEQCRIHGQLRQKRRDHDGGHSGFRQTAGSEPEEGDRLGGTNPGGALDDRDRRLEEDAGRRLGKDLVARQNNILFSVLAQYFGADAINDRLLLIETISFTTTPADMLEALTRVVADRSVGAIFFGNYKLMDYELMGGDARTAIIVEIAKRGLTPVLPPAVPFGSHQWPALITAGSGPTSLADLP